MFGTYKTTKPSTKRKATIKKLQSPKGPPRLPFCRYCNRQYGSASITIHEQACAKKYHKPFVPRTKVKRKVLMDDSMLKLAQARTNFLVKTTLKNEAHSPAEYETLSILKHCIYCSRRFTPDRIHVHEKVCIQNPKKHRKRLKFQSRKQRLQGTEGMRWMRRSRAPPKKKSTWREQHKALILAARAGRSLPSQSFSQSMMGSRDCLSFHNHPGLSRSGLLPATRHKQFQRQSTSFMPRHSHFPGLSPTFKTRRRL